jgi:hypothetical protein
MASRIEPRMHTSTRPTSKRRNDSFICRSMRPPKQTPRIKICIPA